MVTDQTAGAAPKRFRALSIALKVFAAFAIVSGAYDIITGTAFLSGMGGQLGTAAGDAVLNSQLRFLSAIWLGFGAATWWVADDIANRGTMLVILSLTVFLGGLARLVSAPFYGTGPALFIGFMIIEIAGPIAALWIYRQGTR